MAEDQDIPFSHLQRRKIEGRLLVPFIQACSDMFGEDAARKLVTATIRRLVAAGGANWAESDGCELELVRRIAENVWGGGGGLDIDIVERTEDRLFFNVIRCRYEECYKEAGLTNIGALAHCDRDRAMIAGLNPDIELVRTRTIMNGASHCDFRFRTKPRAMSSPQRGAAQVQRYSPDNPNWDGLCSEDAAGSGGALDLWDQRYNKALSRKRLDTAIEPASACPLPGQPRWPRAAKTLKSCTSHRCFAVNVL
jgi:hypothetical protein